MNRQFASDIEPGDRLQWCGRWVDVLRVEFKRSYAHRYGLLITVKGTDVSERSLNYFDDEPVSISRED